jgi:glycosyltransferase involved in cell wall biosynthesis
MNNFYPWEILNIDLQQDISSLPKTEENKNLYLIFWWGNIPLGHQEIHAHNLPISAEEAIKIALITITPTITAYLSDKSISLSNSLLKNQSDLETIQTICQPLTQLQNNYQKNSEKTATLSVSVVICTRDRSKQLAQCLESLQNLSPPPQEIIVVDNAPTDNLTQQVVEQMSNVSNIKYVLEPRPGLDIARNTGLFNCTGDIIAYTDDDVMIHPYWIRQLQYSFINPKTMAVTGLVLAGEITTESQYIFEKFSSFNRGYQPILFDSEYFKKYQKWGVPVWHIGAGANMAFRRNIFELVGNFDERLDVGAAGCSGDSEMWYRILAEGYDCRYEPTTIVYHFHRRDLSKLNQQMFYYMRGHVAALMVQFEKYKHYGNLRRLFLNLPKYYSSLIFEGLLKGYKNRHVTLFSEIFGYFSGIKFYLTGR